MTFLKRTSTKKLAIISLLPILILSFLSVGLSFAQQDTAILNMNGKDWSIKIDGQLQTTLDSKNTPYTSVAKAGTEKELFLTLNSLKDCTAGQIQFKIETNGLTIYKQLPLDKELNVTEYDFVNATVAMIKDQVVVSRPENVVNSFACFDESGRKVLHIYASKLIDAKGNSVWVDSDLEDGLLTVYLDLKWLDTAAFPVIVDPTFGYTSVGASYNRVGGDSYFALNVNVTEDAENIGYNFYCGYEGTDSQPAKCGIYDGNGALVSGTESNEVNVVGTYAWYYTPIASAKVLTADEYYILVSFKVGSANNFFRMYYDSGTNLYSNKFETYGTLPATIGAPQLEGGLYSLYVNYTAYVAPTPTPSPSPSPTPETGVTYLAISTNTAIYIFMALITVLSLYLIIKPFSYLNIVVGIFALAFNGYTILTFTQIHWLIPFFALIISLICIIRATNLMERS